MTTTQSMLQSRLWKRLCIAVVAALSLTLLAACGSGGSSADGDKPTITVGSKNFTEQVIISELAAALLEDAGYDVERQLNLGSTSIIHKSLLNGEVDTYLEYTGTALTAILDLPTNPDPQTVYNTVEKEYADRFKVAWLEPWGFNNTYALAMRRSHAEELGIKTISDLKGKAGQLTLGTDREFLNRPDGMPGLKKTYGFEFGDARTMDAGLMYSAVAEGSVDIITAYSTDGRIPALDLVLLEDDKKFFPPYYPAPILLQETLDKHPEVGEILNKLAGKIDDKTMAELNKQVDEEKQDPADVAENFLKEQGLIN